MKFLKPITIQQFYQRYKHVQIVFLSTASMIRKLNSKSRKIPQLQQQQGNRN